MYPDAETGRAPPEIPPRPSWWARAWDRLVGRSSPPAPTGSRLELPWRYHWEHLPKRTAGFGFTDRDYEDARQRAEAVAEVSLGPHLWRQLQRDGYLDVPSRLHPGLTYRLRIGRRIEVICAPGVSSPWPYAYLCINPAYPLPEAEFFAHLYLYVRDQEDEVVRVAAPQPWDQALGRTFS